MNLFLCNYLLLIGLPLNIAEDKSLTASVYYESLCPDSRNFFINQLTDNYITDKLFDIVNLELIPYGKAILNQTSNDYNCQFDPYFESAGVHCRANSLHLCIVNLYFNGQSISSKQRAMQLINCSFTSTYWRTDYATAIDECHQQLYHTSAQPIFNCYDTSKRQLLDAAAYKTALLNPALDYVPWIAFEYAKLFKERQKEFEIRFKDSVVGVLPDIVDCDAIN